MTVERYFEQHAEQFDGLYRRDSRWRYYLNRVVRRALFERVRVTLAEMEGHDFTVLDVGCGPGRNAAAFAQAGGRVTGVDFSERMIAMARQFSRAQRLESRCEFVQGDFLKHEFAEKFDYVVALGVFDYVSDAHTVLEKMLAVARKKVIASFPGMSLVRTPLRKLRYALRQCPVHFYTKRDLAAICAAASLRDYRLIRCGSAGWVLVGKAEVRIQ